ncbi:LlaJI family restriction endonuclease [Peptoniphilus rhinitidis]|uniref:LlaJI family restriction endonuclease n=1 Tax=Peptoniphilus rhinitidis TaxID=1175452 RepID=UPI0023560275|nr:LlaJI family restriction endonuclease [Peptoniphilus rhinitidis]
MTLDNFTFVNDGQPIYDDFMNEWDIRSYCDVRNSKATISFVGIVIKKNKTLCSLPKHYDIDDNASRTMEKILKLIELNRNSLSSFDKGSKEEFPIKAYFKVANYFKIYGLYTSKISKIINGYGGNIDWQRTIKKSNNIITNNGVIFFPFKIKKKYNINEFLSECMEYVLEDASKYKEFIPNIINYKKSKESRLFDNLNFVKKNLMKIKNAYFKDHEKHLIQGLIDYIEWKSTCANNVKLITLEFDDYWEKMIEVYLNKNFEDYIDDTIKWGKNPGFKFYKPHKIYVENNIEEKLESKMYRCFKVEFDHYCKVEDKIYIFDSKYFGNYDIGLNYKQLFYEYFLRQKYDKALIVNGLLIPTNKQYSTRIHIDRTDLDGVKIIEHYINLEDVLDCAFDNRKLLKFN